MAHKEPTLDEVEQELIKNEVPGLIIGLKRVPLPKCNTYHSHVYTGTFSDPEEPLCPYGWNDGDGYSIWRGNVGRGICKRCLKKAHEWRVQSIRALNKSNAERDNTPKSTT